MQMHRVKGLVSKRTRKRSKQSIKNLKREIAKERIKRLFIMAELFVFSYPELSKRYCWLIERIRKAVNLRLSKEQKIKYCKKCFTYWIPGKSVKIVFNHSNHRVIYKCLICGYERSFVYKGKRKKEK